MKKIRAGEYELRLDDTLVWSGVRFPNRKDIQSVIRRAEEAGWNGTELQLSLPANRAEMTLNLLDYEEYDN